MATKKRNTRPKRTAVARRRRVATMAPARRTRSRSKHHAGKFDIVQSIVMPMAGAGIGIIAGNAISKMIPSIPYAKALIPLAGAYVAGTMLKQPAIAAGMAAAGGIALLNQFSPTMFADEALEFLNEDTLPMVNFMDDMPDNEGGNFEALQQYNDASNGGYVQYDAMNNPLVVLPDGSMQYV